MSSTSVIKTKLSQLIPEVTKPIVCGPMAGAAGGELAARVSKAGGFGYIGAGYFTSEKLKSELDLATSILGPTKPGLTNRLPLGIGFLAWRLSLLNGSKPPPSLGSQDMDSNSPALELIDTALKFKPRSLWLAFGDELEMRAWSRVLREREAAINGGGKLKWGNELKLAIGIGNLIQAKEAVEDCGADILSVTGNEAGGHGLSTSPALHLLLPQVIKNLPNWKPTNPSEKRPIILGAGGLSDGKSLTSILALGADGGLFGTRFLCSEESTYTEKQKEILIKAGLESSVDSDSKTTRITKTSTNGNENGNGKGNGDGSGTIRTLAFDQARNTLGWPKDVDGRGLKNQTVLDFENDETKNEESLKKRQERYQKAVEEKDDERLTIWAGTGIGLINEIGKAEEIVGEIEKEIKECLKRLREFDS